MICNARDGNTVALRETGDAGGIVSSVYLRREGDEAPVRLGEGSNSSLSQDGQWVATVDRTAWQIVVHPTGAGQTRRLDLGKWDSLGGLSFFDRDRRVLFDGRTAGQPNRVYVASITEGLPKAITPDGFLLKPAGGGQTGSVVSGDGSRAILEDLNGDHFIVSTAGDGIPRPLPHIKSTEMVLRWADDGTSVFVSAIFAKQLEIFRVNISTGARQVWQRIVPPEQTGRIGINSVEITSDGQTYGYTYIRNLSTLYLVKGLK